jgi:hypothetical protein
MSYTEGQFAQLSDTATVKIKLRDTENNRTHWMIIPAAVLDSLREQMITTEAEAEADTADYLNSPPFPATAPPEPTCGSCDDTGRIEICHASTDALLYYAACPDCNDTPSAT